MRIALALVSTCIAANAVGADVPAEMKSMNTKLCMGATAVVDPQAPKDKAQIPKYCECVTDSYWASVPQSEYEGMIAESRRGIEGPATRKMDGQLDARMKAAQKKCKVNN
jgi:hypothetical protein